MAGSKYAWMRDYSVGWDIKVYPDTIINEFYGENGHVLIENYDGLVFEVDANVWNELKK